MDRDRKVISWPLLAVLVVIILVTFFVLMSRTQARRSDLEAKFNSQETELISLSEALASLNTQLARMGTDGFVENEAREKYDFIKQGEIRFVFTNPEALSDYTSEEMQIIMDEMRYQ